MVLTKKYPMIDTTSTKTKQKAHCDMAFFFQKCKWKTTRRNKLKYKEKATQKEQNTMY